MALSLGLFFGLLVPIAQIPLSAIAAVLLRANIPVAVFSTLITNPVTFAPIYYFAYRLGNLILGEHSSPVAPPVPPESNEFSDLVDIDIPDPGLFGWLGGWWDNLFHAGLPLAVGLITLATIAAMFAYVITSMVWRIRTIITRRRRKIRFRQLRDEARLLSRTIDAAATNKPGGVDGTTERTIDASSRTLAAKPMQDPHA